MYKGRLQLLKEKLDKDFYHKSIQKHIEKVKVSKESQGFLDYIANKAKQT